MRQPRGAVAGFEQHRAAGLTAGIAFEQLARLFIGPGLGDERFGAEIVCVGHDASGCGAWRAKSQMLKWRGLDSAAPARSPTRPPNRVFYGWPGGGRSEEHTSELQSLMRISYAVFCLQQNIRLRIR